MVALIAVVAGVSMLCELYGTLTVWNAYQLTSKTAKKIESQLEDIYRVETERIENPAAHLREFLADSEGWGMYERNVASWSAIGGTVSTMLPSRRTTAGFVAFAVGAVLGYVAVLLALFG